MKFLNTEQNKIQLIIKRIKIAFYISIILLVMSVFFIDNVRQYLAINISKQFGFNVKNIKIEGQVNSDENYILNKVKVKYNYPILNLDLNKIRQEIEDNVWIEHVVVERILPHTLYIGVIENAPIALWQKNNKLYVIDEKQNVILPSSIEKFKYLPLFIGADAYLYSAELLNILKAYPIIYSDLKIVTRLGERRWNLTLNSGLTIKLPEKNIHKALEYLKKSFAANKLNKNAKIIDLRNAKKIYVED